MSDGLQSWILSTPVVIAGLIACVSLLGIAAICRDLFEIKRARKFLEIFGDTVTKFAEDNGADSDTYAWMLHRSSMLEKYLSRCGFGYFSVVAEIRQFHPENHKRLLSRGLPVRSLLETMVQCDGILVDEASQLITQCFNPVSWLIRGTALLVALPLGILSTTNLISSDQAAHWRTSRTYKLLIPAIYLLAAFKGLAPATFDSFIAFLTNLAGGQ